MTIPEQFDLGGKKYSSIGTYSKQDFMLALIERKFPSSAAFILFGVDEDRPAVPVFFDTIWEKLPTIIRDCNYDVMIAVYERMPPIKYPERICGNCKYYVRHYSSRDGSLGLAILDEGHCIGRYKIFPRKNKDEPKEGCFEWNAESQGIIEQIKGGKQ